MNQALQPAHLRKFYRRDRLLAGVRAALSGAFTSWGQKTWQLLTSLRRPSLSDVDPDLTAACQNLRRLLGGLLSGACLGENRQQQPHFFCPCDDRPLAFLG
jgi:hypothetical protein